MSHVASVEVVVRDLDVLRAAASAVGLVLVEGQRTHAWFGRFLNDWSSDRAAARKGRDPATFGTCDHALRLSTHVPGDYEIGVVARPGGDGYDLVYDAFGRGQRLEAVAGVDLVGLRNEVAAHAATAHLTRAGYRVTRTQEAAAIRLTATK